MGQVFMTFRHSGVSAGTKVQVKRVVCVTTIGVMLNLMFIFQVYKTVRSILSFLHNETKINIALNAFSYI